MSSEEASKDFASMMQFWIDSRQEFTTEIPALQSIGRILAEIMEDVGLKKLTAILERYGNRIQYLCMGHGGNQKQWEQLRTYVTRHSLTIEDIAIDDGVTKVLMNIMDATPLHNYKSQDPLKPPLPYFTGQSAAPGCNSTDSTLKNRYGKPPYSSSSPSCNISAAHPDSPASLSGGTHSSTPLQQECPTTTGTKTPRKKSFLGDQSKGGSDPHPQTLGCKVVHVEDGAVAVYRPSIACTGVGGSKTHPLPPYTPAYQSPEVVESKAGQPQSYPTKSFTKNDVHKVASGDKKARFEEEPHQSHKGKPTWTKTIPKDSIDNPPAASKTSRRRAGPPLTQKGPLTPAGCGIPQPSSGTTRRWSMPAKIGTPPPPKIPKASRKDKGGWTAPQDAAERIKQWLNGIVNEEIDCVLSKGGPQLASKGGLNAYKAKFGKQDYNISKDGNQTTRPRAAAAPPKISMSGGAAIKGHGIAVTTPPQKSKVPGSSSKLHEPTVDTRNKTGNGRDGCIMPNRRHRDGEGKESGNHAESGPPEAGTTGAGQTKGAAKAKVKFGFWKKRHDT